jgi:hypothetical protein
MKLNLNKSILGLDGKEIPEVTLGKVVAQVIAQENKGDAVKKWYWATKLYGGEEIDLNPEEEKEFKEMIKNNETLTVMAKAQVLAEL